MHDVMSSGVPFVIPYSILWNFLEKFGIGSQLFSLEILLAYLLRAIRSKPTTVPNLKSFKTQARNLPMRLSIYTTELGPLLRPVNNVLVAWFRLSCVS